MRTWKGMGMGECGWGNGDVGMGMGEWEWGMGMGGMGMWGKQMPF